MNKKRTFSILMVLIMMCSFFMQIEVKAENDKGFVIRKGVLVSYKGNEESVKIPKRVKKIAPKAFFGKTGLKKVIIPANVRVIGKKAFYGCINLQGLKLKEGIKNIESEAFGGCKALKSLVIPESVKNIGSKAFINCKNLEKVEFSGDSTLVKKNVFAGCEKLKNLSVELGEKLSKDTETGNEAAKMAETVQNKEDKKEKNTENKTGSTAGIITGGYSLGGSSAANKATDNTQPLKTEKTLSAISSIADVKIGVNTTKEGLESILPKRIKAVLSDKSEALIEIKFWKGMEGVKLNEAGKYSIEAEYDLPQGVKGEKKAIKVTVVVEARAIRTIKSIEAELNKLSVEYGADWNKIVAERLPKTLKATLSDGSFITISGVSWTVCNTHKAGATATTAIYKLPEGISGDIKTCAISIDILPDTKVKPSLKLEERDYYYADNPVITIENLPENTTDSDIRVEADKDFGFELITAPAQYTVAGNKITIITDKIFNRSDKAFASTTDLGIRVHIKGERVPGQFKITYLAGKAGGTATARKKMKEIVTAGPDIEVEAGTRRMDIITRLPKEFQVKLTDDSIEKITIKDWLIPGGVYIAGNKIEVRDCIADYSLPDDFDESQEKLEFKGKITIVPKHLQLSLKANAEQYYYEDNPVVKVVNWNNVGEVAIKAVKNNVEMNLTRDTHYTFSDGSIVLQTKEIFKDDAAVKEGAFSEKIDLLLSVKIGEKKLEDLKIGYIAGKKENESTTESKFTAEAIVNDDNGTQDGLAIFESSRSIKLIVKAEGLTRQIVLDKLEIKVQSGTSAEFTIPKTGYGAWSAGLGTGSITISIPADQEQGKIEYKKVDGKYPVTHITLLLKGYGVQKVDVAVAP